MPFPLRARLRATHLLAAAALLPMLGGLTALMPDAAHADVLITAGADKKVKLWNPADGKEIASIDAHDGAVNAVMPSWDGKLLATGGADKKVKIWNLADRKLITTIDAHDDAVTSLMFTPDNKNLVTGGADKKIKIWNVADGKLVKELPQEGAIIAVFAGPGLIISGSTDGKFGVWDGSYNPIANPPTEHDMGLTALAPSLAQQALYTGGGDGSIKYWTLDKGTGQFDGTQGSAIKSMFVLMDGTTLLTGGADGKVKLWDTDAHKAKDNGTIEAHKGAVTAIFASPDGKTIFTGGEDKKVKIWGADGKLIKEIDAHDGTVNAIVYLPDKKEPEKKEEKKANR